MGQAGMTVFVTVLNTKHQKASSGFRMASPKPSDLAEWLFFGFSLFSVELRPEPTAEKRAVKRQSNPFPLTPTLSLREKENHSARLEELSAPGHSVV
jgi:hypothetical protein